MKIVNWVKENSLLTALLIISFLLRIYRLDVQSPWADEMFTLINSSSKKSMIEIFKVLKDDVHPPLYYYIIHFFSLIFGDSSYIARLISVVFGVAGLAAMYYLAKELFGNKNIGLIAVAFLTFNFYHITYSQEARMYTMMFFSTVMAFLYLIRFIKNPGYKSAVFYALFSTLMVYSHFFAMFTLIAQYVILLYFIIKPYKTTTKQFFIYSLVSGIVTLVLYVPALVILFTAGQRDSFWIDTPSNDIFSIFFKDFLGFSEGVIYIALIATLFYFTDLAKQGQLKKNEVDPENEQKVFSGIIFLAWIGVTLLIPYIISYVRFPIMISRYFINLLPAIALMVAAGINYVKNSAVQISLILVFVVFSFTDTFFVEKYYWNVTKTQFRESSVFVKENHKDNDKIYSTFGIFFSYYLTPEDHNEITAKSLNNIAADITAGNEKPKSFWFIDMAEVADPPTEQTVKVIDSLYAVDKQTEGVGVYAKHYVNRDMYVPTADPTKFKPYKPYNGSEMLLNVESVNDAGATAEISGWAYFKDQTMDGAKIFVVLVSDTKDVTLTPERVDRQDVTEYFKSSYDLKKSGFKCTVNKASLEKGTYKIAVYALDAKTKKESLALTDKVLTVN